MTVTIWHNPRCSKSRQALELIRSRGIEPEIVEYLKHPPEEATIRKVLELSGIEVRDLMRTGEAVYKDLGLAAVRDEAALIKAMAQNPVLIERPVVIADGRAVIGRPPEKVLQVL